MRTRRPRSQRKALMPAEHSIPEDTSHPTLIIVVAVISAVVIGGFFFLLLRRALAPTAPPTFAGAIRPGSPDWEKYSQLIERDDAPSCVVKRARGYSVNTVRNNLG